MTGRAWSRVLVPLLLAAIVVTAVDGTRRLRRERLLRQVEERTAAVIVGKAPATLLVGNLMAIEAEVGKRPRDVRFALARAGQLLLLNRPAAAIAAYEEALELGERPETHLNLGRALLQVGRSADAQEHLTKAVALDPRMQRQIPTSLQ